MKEKTNKKLSKKLKTLISIGTIFSVLFITVMIYYFGASFAILKTSQKEVTIPGLSDGFIPQGTCYIDNHDTYLISGYMKDTSKKSRIYSVNKTSGNIASFTVNTGNDLIDYGHFCGLADSTNTLWLVTDGFVVRFNLLDFLNSTNNSEINSVDIFDIDIATDFCYSTGTELFVGEFYRAGNYETDESHYINTSSGLNKAIALCFDIDESKQFGIDSTNPTKVLSLPHLSQGLCITDSGKIVISTSYGLAASHLYVYNQVISSNTFEYNSFNLPLIILDSESLVQDIEAPSMTEGLDYQNGRVSVLFESASNKYKLFTRTRMKSIISFELS